MKTCWKCGDDELGMRPIVYCADNDDDECTACHRDCLEKRDHDEDLDPVEVPDQGEQPGEVEI